MLDVVYSHHFVLPLPPGHRFPMEKYRLLYEKVALLSEVIFHEAPPASIDDLLLAHDTEYVNQVISGDLSEQMIKEIGFPWSPAMVERSRRSVGATIKATELAIKNSVGVSLAGGTHHAHRNRGGGFCVFNDVAVTALRLLHDNPTRQIAIVDLDVHQGDGSASILKDKEKVFTLSLHGENNYPFRKEESTLDLALPDGCDDVTYLNTLENALNYVERQLVPDHVLFIAGSDPHEEDRLGRLALSNNGLSERDKMVFEWAKHHHASCTVVMGGGYTHNIETSVTLHYNTVALATHYTSNY